MQINNFKGVSLAFGMKLIFANRNFDLIYSQCMIEVNFSRNAIFSQ